MPRLFTKNWPHLILIFFVAFGISFFSASAIRVFLTSKNQPPETASAESLTSENPTPEQAEAEPKTPEFIDLQFLVDQWIDTLSPNVKVGLMIYDLDNDRVAAASNPDLIMNTASVYKLFFAYDGYREIARDLASPDDYFTTTEKGNLTYGDCLDLIIRESYNGCAESLRTNAAASERVTNLISELGLTSTTNLGLSSTAYDLVELLKLYYAHPDLTPELWSKIQDSMLNQPPTTYNWRQGLPSGFNQALVYDKVGWDWNGSAWNIYNDVALIDFPGQNRHYAVAILTSGLASYEPLVTFGSQFETAVLSSETVPDTETPEYSDLPTAPSN